MTSATLSKVISATFSGATTNDPVFVVNTTTGEVRTTNPDGTLIRLESKNKGILFDCNNFVDGWTVGDIVEVRLGGAYGGVARITLTAATNAPQLSAVTAAAASTAVLTI